MMDKAEIKIATVTEIGCRFEDMLEAAKLEVARNEGAKVGIQMASRKILELQSHVDKDLDEGKLQLEGELAVASLVKQYIARACAVLETGVVTAENHRLMAQGRVGAFEQMIENMGKLRDLEIQKEQKRKEVEAGAVHLGHVVGIAPGLTLKEQRKLEERPTEPPLTTRKRPSRRRKDAADSG